MFRRYGLTIDPRPMYSRKQQKRLRKYLLLVTVALVLNVLVPTTASAKAASPSVPLAISNAVLSQTVPNEVPSSSLTTLPTPTDKPIVITKTMTLRASAYSSTVDQTDADPFTTASGAKVADGIIAMNGVKFGTKIRIPSHFGNKVFVVMDRMNARWGTSRIDIWMPTRHQAIDWGVRTVSIEIIS